jgi:hypothetical protein
MHKSNWHPMRDWPCIISLLFLLGFAMFAPPDILTRFTLLNDFVNLFARHMPFIEAYAAASVWPEVTKATLGLAMAAVPVVFIFFVQAQFQIQDPKRLTSDPKVRRWGWLLIFAVAMPFYMGGPDIPQSTRAEVIDALILSSRFALGVYAGTVMLLEVVLLVWSVIWVKTFILRDR